MQNKNKRELILDTTEELMCQTGDDISVDTIAKKAGIGKGSIYYYFNSKEEIINAVIERSYSNAIQEFFADVYNQSNALLKIKTLFRSVIKEEFNDNRKNILTAFHVHDNLLLHTKMMITSIKTISPILTKLLSEGVEDGSIHTDTPQESAEMIIAMLTFLLDNSFFPADNESLYRKLKLYANVLETCLQTEKGSFDFLFTLED
ncbi:MAG: TetR/AcrR family transcriptional regulator [Acutalibacteraceae bacterium]